MKRDDELRAITAAVAAGRVRRLPPRHVDEVEHIEPRGQQYASQRTVAHDVVTERHDGCYWVPKRRPPA